MNTKVNDTREQIIDLRNKGYSYKKIGQILNISPDTVLYLYKKPLSENQVMNIERKRKEQEEYEKIVCENIPKVTSLNSLCKLMGKRSTNNNYLHFKRIIEKYNIDTSHFSQLSKKKSYSPSIVNDNEYFILDTTTLKQGKAIKKRLIDHKIKEHKCERCGLTHWENETIPLELHHINGNRYDNRIENLQLLCPNCHAQTDNYRGKNANKTKKINVCNNCGKTFYNGEGSAKWSNVYCSIQCKEKKMQENKQKHVKSKHLSNITKEKLIELFKEKKSFVGISKIFGVTDNAIRKWFKMFDLPTHTPEMKKYIIETNKSI